MRLGLFAASARCLAVLGGRSFYRARHLSAGALRVREEWVPLPAHARTLAGLRVVQLSDLHAGPFLRLEDLGSVFARVRELKPDLVVLTGDYLTDTTDEALELARGWPDLGPRLGSLAVLGNHDYRGRREGELAAAFQQRGVRTLRNQCARFERSGAALAVVGLEDLEEARTLDLEAARQGVRPSDVELVLCHHPAGALQLARPQCVAVLSGHTHGQQLHWPWLATLGPAHPGGHVQLGSTLLVVSNGLGAIGVPLRVRAPAEIVVLELRAAVQGPNLAQPRGAPAAVTPRAATTSESDGPPAPAWRPDWPQVQLLPGLGIRGAPRRWARFQGCPS
jgi:hypothetical protein